MYHVVSGGLSTALHRLPYYALYYRSLVRLRHLSADPPFNDLKKKKSRDRCRIFCAPPSSVSYFVSTTSKSLFDLIWLYFLGSDQYIRGVPYRSSPSRTDWKWIGGIWRAHTTWRRGRAIRNSTRSLDSSVEGIEGRKFLSVVDT